MYTYILCEFQYGYNGSFYQEIDELGNLVRMVNLDGSTLVLNEVIGVNPEPYGAIVVNSNPIRPIWAV